MSAAESFDTIDPLDAEWLWEGRMPVAEMVIVASVGGKGKGVLAVERAARISRGENGEPPGSVVIVAAEDDSAVVTAPRLIAAGADMSRIYDLSEPFGTPFLLTEHMGLLRATLGAIDNPRLVILDPLSAVAGVSLTSVAKVRSILSPLQAIARSTGVTMMINHHLTKAGSVAGSQAVVDAVRCVLLIDDDPDDENVCVLRVGKSNMGASGVPDLRYKIVGNDDGQPVVEWLHEIKLPKPAQDLLSAALTAEAAKPDAKPLTAQQLTGLTGLPYSTVRVTLRRMTVAGTVTCADRGLYGLPVTVKDETADQGT